MKHTKERLTTMANHHSSKNDGSKMILTTTANHDEEFVISDIPTNYIGVILLANHDG